MSAAFTGAHRKDNVSVSFWLNVAPTASVAVMVNVKVPKPRETPVMLPLAPSRMPGGRLPAVREKVLTPVPPWACTEVEYIEPIFVAGRLTVVITTGGLIVMLK